MFRMSGETTLYELRPLGECVEVLDSFRKPINSDARRDRQGEIPYYGANGQVGTIDEWIFDEDLVLVAEDGGFFDDPVRPISYRISGKSWVNNHAHVLRPREGIDVDWLNYTICQQDIRHLIKGATLKKLNQRELRKILIPCPILDEQRRIVSQIKDCMARVEEIEKIKQKAQNEIDSLVPAALEDVFHINGAKEVPLPDVLAEKPKNGIYLPKDAYTEKGGIPIIRMGEMFRRFEVKEQVEKSVFDNGKLQKQYGLNTGDVLVARRSIVYEGSGSMAVVTAKNLGAIFESSIIRLRVNQRIMLPEYFVAFFHSREGLRRRLAITKKATISGVNQEGLSTLKVPMPSIDKQRDAIERVGIIRKAHERIMEEMPIEEISALRESILRKAFSGEL